ncbi:MAG: TerB family tellurite resistance protein [Alphaproteobacteria bacterium]|nr:TerB family tellurite resistance protein [Alphaproteobacteria bacterium]MBU6471888.1 TerB family tellurite resistance protein [Alphaproteobacteria bacterium]MDE2011613.1 TerB family tellurite resistance protein [Alphaproteobacteria bacterium]MDE2073833.1 TerB family tellurite resistance protein [Alphaproteobacteria bacterium]MDE2352457.1 TerB family tellurite resistance protein [Alphaproteobacteria bacterium]
MSIWGKLGGAAAGFLLGGGPIGALLGAFAGHMLFDRDDLPAGESADAPGVVFTIAIIALGAKMAKADGVVTKDEEDAFKRIFRVPPSEEANVRRIFNLARQDTAGFEVYAAQIARLFRGNPAILEDVLDGLFEIAKADGVLHPGELAFLEGVADIFGFTPGEFRRIRASHFGPDAADPYAILGVAHDASDDEIKRTYRMLVRENHPDSLIARGVPEEFVKLANDKLAAINTAYERIVKERK